MLWGGPRRSKTSQSLFRVGMRWGGCRQPSPQHSMVVVCVRSSRELRVDLNATVSALAVPGRKSAPRGAVWALWRSLNVAELRSATSRLGVAAGPNRAT
jgi:hypothetical protein